MSLWVITVEAWDETGNGDYYEAVVLAHTERGARKTATSAVKRTGLTGAHSVGALELDPYTTGLIAAAKRDEYIVPPKRQEEW